MGDVIPENGLDVTEKEELIKALKEFKRWILSKKIVSRLPDISGTYELPFASEDWMMKFDAKKKKVSFNTFVRQKSSFDHYKSIVLHEFFHLVVQKVPTKDEAVKIKDDFGNELMKLIDIEADFFTALFYKEKYGYDLVQYLKLYWEGSKVFSDTWIRISKFERYIGTLLSISKMFIDGHNKKQCTDCDLFLPAISPLYTEDNFHILVIKKEHIHFDSIGVSYDDFKSIKKCYTNIDTYTYKGYVETIVDFVCNAFRIKRPTFLQEQINSITS